MGPVIVGLKVGICVGSGMGAIVIGSKVGSLIGIDPSVGFKVARFAPASEGSDVGLSDGLTVGGSGSDSIHSSK